MSREGAYRLLEPAPGALPVDGSCRLRQQRTAELRLFVAEDHAGAAICRGLCGGNPRGSAADDQHVAVREAMYVPVRVRQRRRATEAGRGTDQGFVKRRPGDARPHERLVVEAGGKQRRQQIVQPADVEAEARPAVLGFGNEAVIELDLGRAQVRRDARGVAAHGDQRIGLLGARREDSARAMVFERPPDQVHAVREQRRRERVALQTLEGFAVEGESQRSGPVHAPAARRAECAQGRSPIR